MCEAAFLCMFPHLRIQRSKIFRFNRFRFKEAEPGCIHKCAAISEPKLRMARGMPAAFRLARKAAYRERKLWENRVEQ